MSMIDLHALQRTSFRTRWHDDKHTRREAPHRVLDALLRACRLTRKVDEWRCRWVASVAHDRQPSAEEEHAIAIEKSAACVSVSVTFRGSFRDRVRARSKPALREGGAA
jgi:hypothetical protein